MSKKLFIYWTWHAREIVPRYSGMLTSMFNKYITSAIKSCCFKCLLCHNEKYGQRENTIMLAFIPWLLGGSEVRQGSHIRHAITGNESVMSWWDVAWGETGSYSCFYNNVLFLLYQRSHITSIVNVKFKARKLIIHGRSHKSWRSWKKTKRLAAIT